MIILSSIPQDPCEKIKAIGPVRFLNVHSRALQYTVRIGNTDLDLNVLTSGHMEYPMHSVDDVLMMAQRPVPAFYRISGLMGCQT
jgi:hypothetical protein